MTEPYEGGDIVLNEALGIRLSPRDYPVLLHHTGKRLIVTDGTTLLGADDKAGVAEILTCAERLLRSGKPHGAVRIGFTPDEEIGRGATGSMWRASARTMPIPWTAARWGEIEYENFNAAAAEGGMPRPEHPSRLGPGEDDQRRPSCHGVPPAAAGAGGPAATDGYEGFYHLTDMSGHVEEARLRYIVRDHDAEKFARRCRFFQKAADFLNEKYGSGTVEATVTESYRNMKEKILPHMHIVTAAKAAMEACGVTPQEVPIRGGTDGARLSYEGLPCPNLCTGGENFHGRFEFIPVEDMEKVVDILEQIVLDACP